MMTPFILHCVMATLGQMPPARFEVTTIDPPSRVGAVEELTADGTLRLGDRENLSAGQWIGFRRLTDGLPPWPTASHVVLHRGDIIAGSPSSMAGAFLRFRASSIVRNHDDDQLLRIPLTSIAYLWFRSPASIDRDKHPAFFELTRESDQILLENGDTMAGAVVTLDARNAELIAEVGGEQRVLALKRVVAIAFNTKLVRVRRPTGPFGRLILRDGGRLSVTSPQISERVLKANTLDREQIQIALDEVVAFDIEQGPAVHLSDSKPSRYRYRAFGNEGYEWMADRNLERQSLRLKTPLGVETFDKGVSVHGECELSYALDAAYRRFDCVVGLDPVLGARGNVELLLRIDDKELKLNEGRSVTLAKWPVRVSVDLRGARELTLIVRWGEGGHVGDHVNWCDARLIREPAATKNPGR